MLFRSRDGELTCLSTSPGSHWLRMPPWVESTLLSWLQGQEQSSSHRSAGSSQRMLDLCAQKRKVQGLSTNCICCTSMLSTWKKVSVKGRDVSDEICENIYLKDMCAKGRLLTDSPCCD